MKYYLFPIWFTIRHWATKPFKAVYWHLLSRFFGWKRLVGASVPTGSGERILDGWARGTIIRVQRWRKP